MQKDFLIPTHVLEMLLATVSEAKQSRPSLEGINIRIDTEQPDIIQVASTDTYHMNTYDISYDDNSHRFPNNYKSFYKPPTEGTQQTTLSPRQLKSLVDTIKKGIQNNDDQKNYRIYFTPTTINTTINATQFPLAQNPLPTINTIIDAKMLHSFLKTIDYKKIVSATFYQNSSLEPLYITINTKDSSPTKYLIMPLKV